MNAHDELSDNEVLRTAAKSLSAIPMASHPDVAAILARGRAHRRHRLSAVAGLPVAAAATALALGLTGALSPAPAPGAIRTVSFTLVSNHNGTATLTINPHELLDAAALQNDLQRYGIPAKVTSGSFCSSDPEPHGGSKAMVVRAGRALAHHHLQPGGHASGHRTQHRLLPAQLGHGGRPHAHQHHLLHLHQHSAPGPPG